MAISAVSSVSFRNNYIQFEGGKKKKGQGGEHRHTSAPLKAVPLAVMLAMSPLNTSSSVYASNKGVPVEMAQSSQGVNDFDYIPKPAHFNILAVTADEQYNEVSGSTRIKEFKLIDTDNDPSDYELIEYIHRSHKDGHNERILERGIIRSVLFREGYAGNSDQKVVYANGILLDTDNLDNYAPINGILNTIFLGDDFYEFFKDALSLRECRALWEAQNSQDYRELHSVELNSYMNKLNSSK